MKNKHFEKTAKLFCQAMVFQTLKPALDELAKENLTEVQLACIRFAYLHHEPSVGMIADGLSISDAAAAKLVDRLVKKQLLTREEDPQDRRVLKIKLTENGKELLKQILAVESQKFNEILSRMTAAEVKAFDTGLVGFLKAALLTAEEIERVCLKCGLEHETDCPGNLLFHEYTGHDKEKV